MRVTTTSELAHAPSPSCASPALTSELMDDLLDPTNTPVQICKMHALTLTDLAAIITSDAFRQAAQYIMTINAARTPVIDSSDELQSRSLQRAIAQDAYLAAVDMDQATSTANPKLAAIRARFLEIARKANPVQRRCTASTHTKIRHKNTPDASRGIASGLPGVSRPGSGCGLCGSGMSIRHRPSGNGRDSRT